MSSSAEAVGPASSPFLIAVGASAGGLEALTRLLSRLPRDLPAAVVIIQHLSASHRSLLVQLLGRETPLPVEEAAHGLQPAAGVVYIAPAKHDTTLDDDARFALADSTPGATPHPSVDIFLHSVARVMGERSAAVVLSGTGSDGAAGIRAVKAAGGYTLAQDPASARYEGMPQSALDTGVVDWVLTPERLAEQLVAVVGSDDGATPVAPVPPRDALTRLLAAVRQRTRIDFSGYKETTLQRRIARRIVATCSDDFPGYVTHALAEPLELERLAKDILISVTGFFRDAPAFDALRRALVDVVARKQSGDELRIWVPGCATGEEAYSIAMLLADAGGAIVRKLRVQIFATDIDLDALALARRGVYSRAALPARVGKLLGDRIVDRGKSVEVAKPIREMVVFARQDVILDPPFLRLDLVSCRNLLIYFQQDLQRQVLDTFAYALNTGGYLLLGKSESLGNAGVGFEPFDHAARLFRLRSRARVRPDRRMPSPDGNGFGAARQVVIDPLERLFADSVLARYAPAALLVNRDGEILFTSTGAREYLAVPEGRVRLAIGNALDPALRGDAQVLLHRARSRGESQRGQPRPTSAGMVCIAVHEAGDDDGVYLIAFERVAEDKRRSTAARSTRALDSDIKAVQDELASTREHLQTVIEELETSNEETQALNEELQSANEELQTSNEELQSANEELQSTNEELSTVNDELQGKATALLEAKSELETTFASLPDGLLVVDADLRLTRCNAPAARLLGIVAPPAPGTVRVSELTGPIDTADLTAWIVQVLQSGAAAEHALRLDAGTLIVRIAAFGGVPVRGAVVSITDTTAVTATERALRESERRLDAVMRYSLAATSVRDVSGRIEQVNPRFEALHSVDAASVLGRSDVEAFPGALGIALADAHAQVVAARRAIELEEDAELANGPRRLLTLRFPLFDGDGHLFAVCTKSVDITARHHAELAVVAAKSQLQAILGSLEAHIAVVDAAGVIIMVNHAWRRFAVQNGAAPSADAFIGASYLQVCGNAAASGDASAAEVAEGLKHVLSGAQQVFRHEYPCHGHDEQRWFVVEITALGVPGGGAAITHTPITARKLAEAELARLRESLGQRMAARLRELDTYNRELESFAYSVSHDLKTPLRAISGFAALLAEESRDRLEPRAREHLDRILDSTRRMARLIDDLLKLSRFARTDLHVERVDLSAMALEVAEELRALAPDRTAEILIADDLVVTADPRLMRVVLDNLIGNAWKYTSRRPRTRIEVGLTVHADERAMFVRDNGCGFDMTYYEKLFLPFQRLHDPGDYAGDGIGLATVQRIIQRHGGKVWADSTVGYGSTFYFSLPELAGEA